MEVLSSGELSIYAPIPTKNNHEATQENFAKETKASVEVSISLEARAKYDEELKQTEKESTEKKDFGAPLRAEDSKLSASKIEDKDLSAEEKLDQRIEEVKEKIKKLQQEINALSADNSEEAEDKIQLLNQHMQALLGELNGLMEQKLESMKKG
jgi:hypothetical protein